MKHDKTVDFTLPLPIPLECSEQKDGIQLIGELVACLACSGAKGRRVLTPNRQGARRGRWISSTMPPYPAHRAYSNQTALAKRVHWSVFLWRNVSWLTLAFDAYRVDNGTEYWNGLLVDFCSKQGTRCEFLYFYNPQQNGAVGCEFSRMFKAGHAAIPRVLCCIRMIVWTCEGCCVCYRGVLPRIALFIAEKLNCYKRS